jgi:protein SCO1/2
MYAINDGKQQGGTDKSGQDSYLVGHSASLVLINPAGDISAIFKPKHVLGELPTINGDDLVSDFEKIVRLF